MKKVLHISTTYLKASETFIYSFVKNHNKYSPHVLTEDRINQDLFPDGGEGALNNIAVHEMRKLKPIDRVKNLLSKQVLIRNIASEKEYGKIIEEVKPDIMLAHFGQIGMYATPLKEKYDIPLVTYFYGIDLDYNKLNVELGKSGSGKINLPKISKSNYWRDGYKRLWEKGDAFLTFSSKARTHLISFLGAPEDKVFSIPGGVDLLRFNGKERTLPKNGEIRLVTVNRLVEKKGVEYAIRAMPTVLEKYPKAQYDIMGKGPLIEELQKIIDALGIGKNVRLLGFTPNNIMDKKLEEAHIFVNPSIVSKDGDMEGWVNVTLMESIAVGLPCVATFESGSETVIPGYTGYICAERDKKSVADNIIKLASDPKKYSEISINARLHAKENFSDKKQTKKLEAFFDKVLKTTPESFV